MATRNGFPSWRNLLPAFFAILAVVGGDCRSISAQPLKGWDSMGGHSFLQTASTPVILGPEVRAAPFVPFTLIATSTVPREGYTAVWNYGDGSLWESFDVRPDFSAGSVFGDEETSEPPEKTVRQDHVFLREGLFFASVSFFSKQDCNPVQVTRIPVLVRPSSLWIIESRDSIVQPVDTAVLSEGQVCDWVATAADGRIYGHFKWSEESGGETRVRSEKFRYLWGFDSQVEKISPGKPLQVTAEFVTQGDSHSESPARGRITLVSSRDGRMVQLLELAFDPDRLPRNRTATFSAPLPIDPDEHFAILVEAFCNPAYKAYFTYSWKLVPNEDP